MGFWKNISICLLTIIVLGIITYEAATRECLYYMRDCIVVNGLSNVALNSTVKRLYLVTAKLFPIVNSITTMHWSVIVETDTGFVNLSTSRFMTVHLYPVIRDNPYYFIPFKWEPKLYTLKCYQLKDDMKDKRLTPYTIAKSTLNFYNTNDKLSYNLFKHNCQHVSQYIIKTFANVEENDAFIMKHSGYELFKRSIKDALNGPKAMI